ncbi:hypothetical protein [Actinocorallia libanotica]|uniref:Immunity protein 35 of polymorphic toxin system n=1 Tax=Actinocorallia libanotica TaxID=46162 RepID=A0ABP4CC47_9ACTN
MAVMSESTIQLLGRNFLRTLRKADLCPHYGPVLERSWMVIDDAVVLTGWYESYHGDRAKFPATTDYEIAVNGRGIPDADLLQEGRELATTLLRRGAAFAWAALHEQHRRLPEMCMAAFVSATPTLYDPNVFTGNVTFCRLHPGKPPYTDPARTPAELVLPLTTNDCTVPMGCTPDLP